MVNFGKGASAAPLEELDVVCVLGAKRQKCRQTDKFVIVTEAAVQPKMNRKKMADLIFNKFGFGHALFET